MCDAFWCGYWIEERKKKKNQQNQKERELGSGEPQTDPTMSELAYMMEEMGGPLVIFANRAVLASLTGGISINKEAPRSLATFSLYVFLFFLAFPLYIVTFVSSRAVAVAAYGGGTLLVFCTQFLRFFFFF